MNFKQQLAMYVCDKLSTSQLPDAAVSALQEGLDSPSLLILAGLNKNENSFVISEYFNKTLEELKIELPNLKEAAIEYALMKLDDLIAGKVDVLNGAWGVLKAINCYVSYNFESIGLDKSYADYITLEELTLADHRWSNKKTNEELMVNAKIILFEDLKGWGEKMKNQNNS